MVRTRGVGEEGEEGFEEWCFCLREGRRLPWWAGRLYGGSCKCKSSTKGRSLASLELAGGLESGRLEDGFTISWH